MMLGNEVVLEKKLLDLFFKIYIKFSRHEPQTYNSRTQEVEASGLPRVQGQCELQRKTLSQKVKQNKNLCKINSRRF